MSNRSKVYVGVDGGGTKTEAVLIDAFGTIRSKAEVKGTNIHNCPLPEITNRLVEVINGVFAPVAAQFAEGFECVTCIGLAGLDTDADFSALQTSLKSLPSTGPIYIANDGLIALASGTDATAGIALIASTGANCFGVNTSGQFAQAGDWGYLLGDQGSSYAIGQKLLATVFREYDGRNPSSLLTPHVLKALNLSAVPQIPHLIYEHSDQVSLIAGLSKILEAPDVCALPSVQKHLETAVFELAESVKAVANRLGLNTLPALEVVLVGGLLKNQLHEGITEQIASLLPDAKVIVPEKSPAMGAASIARRLTSLNSWIGGKAVRQV